MREKEYLTVELEAIQYEYFYDYWFLAGNLVSSILSKAQNGEDLIVMLRTERHRIEEKFSKISDRELIAYSPVFDKDIAWIFPLEEMIESAGIEITGEDEVKELEEFMGFLLALSLEFHEEVFNILVEETEKLNAKWVFRGEMESRKLKNLRNRMKTEEILDLQYGSVAVGASVIDLIFFKSTKYLM